MGVVTPLQQLFYGTPAAEDAPPLGFIADSLDILSGAAIPCMMLVLGALLAYGPKAGALPARTILGAIAVKQLVMPLIGVATCTELA